MLDRLFGEALGFTVRFAARTLWTLAGVVMSAAIRLAPIFFRFSVASTAWAIALLDEVMEGRLTRRPAFTVLAAGGMWASSGFTIPLLFTLLLGIRPDFFSAPLLIVGFAYGIVCGIQVTRSPGWGMWHVDDNLRVGENTR